ncbi:hypothetical protein BC829DRAFT_407764 [Chytridium lagenaria]|nr:hypothetical protein BC829DRAFT_407764 [Chytridium lagenaria]
MAFEYTYIIVIVAIVAIGLTIAQVYFIRYLLKWNEKRRQAIIQEIQNASQRPIVVEIVGNGMPYGHGTPEQPGYGRQPTEQHQPHVFGQQHSVYGQPAAGHAAQHPVYAAQPFTSAPPKS